MDISEPVYVFLSSFTFVALAEIGDKSQLVCMTLAARHRHWPVILGASTAFILLNTLAVVFGSSVATWIPENLIMVLVAILFGAFAIHTFISVDHDSEDVQIQPGHSIFITTLLLITVAEFGDKTQIAIAGLATHMNAIPVWLGATVALVLLSVLGVWAGRTVIQRLPKDRIKMLSGSLFLFFAFLAVLRVFN